MFMIKICMTLKEGEGQYNLHYIGATGLDRRRERMEKMKSNDSPAIPDSARNIRRNTNQPRSPRDAKRIR